MHVGIPVIGLALAAAAFGCAEEECRDRRDCPSGFECEQSRCVRERARGPSVAIDAGARVFPDASRPEADAAVAGDGGGSGLDGGPGLDGGSGLDAGPDGGVEPAPDSRGLVWVAELRWVEPASVFVAFAEFLDESAVTYDERTTLFADGEGNTCAFTYREPVSGAPVGYSAARILVSPGPQPNSAFTLEPVGNGRFLPIQPPVNRIYSQSNNATFTVVSDGRPGGVGDLTAIVPAPSTVFQISPPEGAVLSLGTIPQLNWVPSGVPQEMVSVELYDQDRIRVMRCRVPDDGLYTLPGAAVAAFSMSGPVPPMYLEIRHDNEVTRTAVAGGDSFEVTFRASWGARFAVR